MRRRRAASIVLLLLAVLVAVPVVMTWRQVRQEQLDHKLLAAIDRHDSHAALAALQAGADPNTREEYMTPEPFWKRVFDTLHGRKLQHQYGPPPLILILDDHFELDARRQIVFTAVKDDPNLVEALLERGADPNVKNPNNYNNTPLMLAAWSGFIPSASRLLKHRADLNARNTEGWTPLMHAAWQGKTDMVKYLLKQGADVRPKDSQHRSALTLAHGWEVAQLLDRAGAKE